MHFSEKVKMYSKPARKKKKKRSEKERRGWELEARRRKLDVRGGTRDRRHYIDFAVVSRVNML
jgi:hypothetical protein